MRHIATPTEAKYSEDTLVHSIYNHTYYVYTTVQTVPYTSHVLHKYTHLLTMVHVHCYVNHYTVPYGENKSITNSACAQSDERDGDMTDSMWPPLQLNIISLHEV